MPPYNQLVKYFPQNHFTTLFKQFPAKFPTILNSDGCPRPDIVARAVVAPGFRVRRRVPPPHTALTIRFTGTAAGAAAPLSEAQGNSRTTVSVVFIVHYQISLLLSK